LVLLLAIVGSQQQLTVLRNIYTGRSMCKKNVSQFMHQIRVLASGRVRRIENDEINACQAQGDRRPAVGILPQKDIKTLRRQSRNVARRPERDTEALGKSPWVEGVMRMKTQLRSFFDGNPFTPCLEPVLEHD
jgi:hypothetical protein